MSTILIRNLMALATVNAQSEVLNNADILIRDNRIEKVGHNLPDEADTVIDGSGMVAIPGMVNTHHHLYQTMFRNVPLVQNVKLFDWLINLYQGWRHITPETEYWAAATGLGELLLTGCTCASDHHYLFPSTCGEEIIYAEVEAAKKLGIRFYPTRGSMSRGVSNGGLPPDDVVQTEEAILRASEDFIAKFHDKSPGAMVRTALAPCSPFSVTPGLLKESAALARQHKVLLHTHLAETNDEDDYCISTLGMRPLAFMESVDWIGPDVWYAHGIWFNDEEIKRLGETKTGVAHCPTSNLRLGSGIARVPELLKAGVRVGIAVDGSASNDSSDLLSEARLALFVHRIGKEGVGATNALDTIRLASQGGASVLNWDDELGQIAPGFLADIACFDMMDIAYAGGLHDPLAALLFCNSRRRAHTVIVNGKIVVKEGTLVNMSEREIVEKQNFHASDLIKRARKDINLLERK
ncbi:8-oxoguanine deaminase [Myxococcota bacterium]|nr:8-oxoguanine deaminase [Myxococcota bacterium]MBU1379313.1 8-oxoguanine deaminase [Myxococcota bacterium]MBU1496089.1 8-oxoguanine deaminase [Myxococcota bacterium]